VAIKIITEPTVEPVTLAEAKEHLRVETDDENSYISSLITVCRQECEHQLGRSIGQQTLLLTLDTFPDGAIELPRPSATAINWIKYLDADGALQTFSSANYWLDSSGELQSWALLTSTNDSWPTTGNYANAMTVQYVAGSDAAPKLIKHWILLAVARLYENRESDTDARTVTQSHPFFNRLVDRYWIPRL
jgi:uncharacterized phiE125 gp8 family phage protein